MLRKAGIALLTGALLTSCSPKQDQKSTNKTRKDTLNPQLTEFVQGKDKYEAFLNDLETTTIDAPDTSTMNVDTVHSGTTPLMKQVSHDAFNEAQRFLDDYGIHLQVTENTPYQLRFGTATQHVHDSYNWTDQTTSTTEADTLTADDLKQIMMADIPGRSVSDYIATIHAADITGSEEPWQTRVKESYARIHDAEKTIAKKESLPSWELQDRNITNDTTIARFAYTHPRTKTFKNQASPTTHINIDAHITDHTTYTSTNEQQALTEDLTRSTVHGLGRLAGLIKTSNFPNQNQEYNGRTYSVSKMFEPTIMSSNGDIDGGLTELQADLWRQGVTPGTALYDANKHSDSLDAYYDKTFANTHPSTYTGGHSIQ